MGTAVGLDGCLPLGSCTIYRHILNRIVPVDRGIVFIFCQLSMFKEQTRISFEMALIGSSNNSLFSIAFTITCNAINLSSNSVNDNQLRFLNVSSLQPAAGLMFYSITYPRWSSISSMLPVHFILIFFITSNSQPIHSDSIKVKKAQSRK